MCAEGRFNIVELDQFYTDPQIAKTFVEKINEYSNLNQYDLVIEPSAGTGNFLQYLPEGTFACDLEPKADNIVEMDWFDYQSGYESLYNPIRIAVIGNPPFG